MNHSKLLCILDDVLDIELLKVDVMNVINLVGGNYSQIMCQGLDPNVSDWHTGAGHITTLDNRVESDYKFINPLLRGSIIEKYINKYSAFRSRIMIMPDRKCYSVHRDLTPRIHIPIVTDIHAWMVWPYSSKCYHLEVGKSYWTNTKAMHTFINGSENSRIHFVMCVEK